MDLGAFFSQAGGNSSGKAGGAGYSSDVHDYGNAGGGPIQVTVGGIGTTTAGQTNAAGSSGSNTLLLIAIAVAVVLILRK